VVAARFDVTFGAVSQHLRVLEDAGLVSVRRDGRRRLYQARREQLGPLPCPPASHPWPTWPAEGTPWPPWPTAEPPTSWRRRPLADHIGMVQRLAGGTRLELRGAPESCQGVVRFRWAAIGPGEAVLATGTNVAGADRDGRFRWGTGFWDPHPDLPEPPQRP